MSEYRTKKYPRDIERQRLSMRKRALIRKAERIAAGRCVDCNKKKTKRNPIVGKNGVCKKCRAKRIKHMRETLPSKQKYARIIAWLAGNCSRCRNRKARPGGKTCEECYQCNRRSKEKAKQTKLVPKS